MRGPFEVRLVSLNSLRGVLLRCTSKSRGKSVAQGSGNGAQMKTTFSLLPQESSGAQIAPQN